MGFDFVKGIAPTVETTSGAVIAATDGTAGVTYTTLSLMTSGSAALLSGSVLTFKNGLLVGSAVTPLKV